MPEYNQLRTPVIMSMTYISLGSAMEIGRSCHILKWDSFMIMLDCGAHVGSKEKMLPMFEKIFSVQPDEGQSNDGKTASPILLDFSTLDIVLLSHFHLDHSAILPFITSTTKYDKYEVIRPFTGKIIMTQPTKAILSVQLTEFMKFAPVYDDFTHIMSQIETVNLYSTEKYQFGNKYVEITAYPAGHVIGAAIFEIQITNYMSQSERDEKRDHSNQTQASSGHFNRTKDHSNYDHVKQMDDSERNHSIVHGHMNHNDYIAGLHEYKMKTNGTHGFSHDENGDIQSDMVFSDIINDSNERKYLTRPTQFRTLKVFKILYTGDFLFEGELHLPGAHVFIHKREKFHFHEMKQLISDMVSLEYPTRDLQNNRRSITFREKDILYEKYQSIIQSVQCPDLLITESTLASVNRQPRILKISKFISYLMNHIQKSGIILLPCYALGRLHEIKPIIDKYLPQKYKDKCSFYYAGNVMDAGLKIYERYKDFLNEGVMEKVSDLKPFRQEILQSRTSSNHVAQYVHNEHSEKQSLIIFSSPSILSKGTTQKIFQKIRNDENNLVILPGNCCSETEGIGTKTAQSQKPKCTIRTVGFSAHSDSRSILKFIKAINPKDIVLVHGHPQRMKKFKKLLLKDESNIEKINCSNVPMDKLSYKNEESETTENENKLENEYELNPLKTPLRKSRFISPFESSDQTQIEHSTMNKETFKLDIDHKFEESIPASSQSDKEKEQHITLEEQSTSICTKSEELSMKRCKKDKISGSDKEEEQHVNLEGQSTSICTKSKEPSVKRRKKDKISVHNKKNSKVKQSFVLEEAGCNDHNPIPSIHIPKIGQSIRFSSKKYLILHSRQKITPETKYCKFRMEKDRIYVEKTFKDEGK